ncbi:hypothetical protein DID75_03755 [Candidatus Marinamargulisbacteria bacterium SCGC AG-410-N11]|nr:hypothetical protein DID75_03755 [Candidatus Marinamargulisbacteria bacterium SCGC AG-410-N11]
MSGKIPPNESKKNSYVPKSNSTVSSKMGDKSIDSSDNIKNINSSISGNTKAETKAVAEFNHVKDDGTLRIYLSHISQNSKCTEEVLRIFDQSSTYDQFVDNINSAIETLQNLDPDIINKINNLITDVRT